VSKPQKFILVIGVLEHLYLAILLPIAQWHSVPPEGGPMNPIAAHQT